MCEPFDDGSLLIATRKSKFIVHVLYRDGVSSNIHAHASTCKKKKFGTLVFIEFRLKQYELHFNEENCFVKIAIFYEYLNKKNNMRLGDL